MKTTERTARLVPALAVIAMSVAAVAAAAAAWNGQRQPVEAPALHAQAQTQTPVLRPRADEPVRVIRAPRAPQRQERML